MRKTLIFSVILLGLFSSQGFADDMISAGKNMMGSRSAPVTTSATQTAASAAAQNNDINLPGLAAVKSAVESNLQNLAPESTFGGVKKDIQKYVDNIDSCVKFRNKTVELCDDKYSTTLNGIIDLAQKYGGVISAAVSAFDSCSQISQAMKEINSGLQLYQATCGASKSACDISCGRTVDAISSVRNAKVDCSSVSESEQTQCNQSIAKLNAIKSQLENEMNGSEQPSAVARKTKCAGYAVQLAGAGQQALEGMKTMAGSNNCAEKTSASADNSEGYCRSHGEAPQCNCSLSTNAATSRCICQKDPRNPACASGLDAAGSQSSDKMQLGDLSNLANTKSDFGSGLDLNSDEQKAFTVPPSTGDAGDQGKAVGAGVSGSGSGSGNQLGAGPSTPQSLASKAMSAIGGFLGGGGGASRLPSSEVDGKNPLRQYLPGQDKDPLKKISGAAYRSEVSGKDGKSNWEKVQQRYMDNTRTLMGN